MTSPKVDTVSVQDPTTVSRATFNFEPATLPGRKYGKFKIQPTKQKLEPEETRPEDMYHDYNTDILDDFLRSRERRMDLPYRQDLFQAFEQSMIKCGKRYRFVVLVWSPQEFYLARKIYFTEHRQLNKNDIDQGPSAVCTLCVHDCSMDCPVQWEKVLKYEGKDD